MKVKLAMAIIIVFLSTSAYAWDWDTHKWLAEEICHDLSCGCLDEIQTSSIYPDQVLKDFDKHSCYDTSWNCPEGDWTCPYNNYCPALTQMEYWLEKAENSTGCDKWFNIGVASHYFFDPKSFWHKVGSEDYYNCHEPFETEVGEYFKAGSTDWTVCKCGACVSYSEFLPWISEFKEKISSVITQESECEGTINSCCLDSDCQGCYGNTLIEQGECTLKGNECSYVGKVCEFGCSNGQCNPPPENLKGCQYSGGSYCYKTCCATAKSCDNQSTSYKKCNPETGQWGEYYYSDSMCQTLCYEEQIRKQQEEQDKDYEKQVQEQQYGDYLEEQRQREYEEERQSYEEQIQKQQEEQDKDYEKQVQEQQYGDYLEEQRQREYEEERQSENLYNPSTGYYGMYNPAGYAISYMVILGIIFVFTVWVIYSIFKS